MVSPPAGKDAVASGTNHLLVDLEKKANPCKGKEPAQDWLEARGVSRSGITAVGDSILGNSIFAHAEKGIDLSSPARHRSQP
jgi:hypothetical protein